MPLHPDFVKLRKAMRKQYGEKKGDDVFWGYIQKHKLDETKPMSDQKASSDMVDLFSDESSPIDAQMPPQQPQDPVPTTQVDPTEAPKPQGLGEAETDKPITVGVNAPPTPPSADSVSEVPLHDGMNRREDRTAAAKTKFISVPAYRFAYSAAPKFEGKDAPVIIKSIVLEEGHNVNNWRVLPEEFQKVADQYKAGRHLRVNHDKTVESVIGMSFGGAVIKGADVKQYLNRDIEGINLDGLYVTAEFEANPQDPQVRTNILNGYVVTGSIGLDAEAFCETCGTALTSDENGEMKKMCHHLDAPVYLKNVEVKEYSYVAEPAYEHTQAFPTFSAAVDSIRGSSIINSAPKEEQMSTVQTKVEAQAKKAEGKSEGEGEGEGDADAAAEALAKKYIAFYEKGLKAGQAKSEADAKAGATASVKADDSEPDEDDKQKVKAESEGEGDAEASVKAAFNPQSASVKPKTDQITKVAPSNRMKAPSDLIMRVTRPSEYGAQDKAIAELFRASADTAPEPIRGSLKNALKGRFD